MSEQDNLEWLKERNFPKSCIDPNSHSPISYERLFSIEAELEELREEKKHLIAERDQLLDGLQSCVDAWNKPHWEGGESESEAHEAARELILYHRQIHKAVGESEADDE